MKFVFLETPGYHEFVSSIRVLPEAIANQIAAGEVIERPANVVKELLENSLDAGAKRIFIQFFNGGLPLIHVSDDGCGMDEEDACLCFRRHATGKLTHINDLQTLMSFGFRGEALPSIASVAEVTLRTRKAENDLGCEIGISATKTPACVPCSCPVGTDITVERLFYNVPVRRKFLKSEATESAHIVHCVRLYALAYPNVQFTLKQDGRSVFASPQSENLSERINALWPRRETLPWLPLRASQDTWKLSGVISPPGFGHATPQMLYVFLNRRPIAHPNLVRALRETCRRFLPDKQYPSAFLFLEMPGTDVDINVHPTKREVRFKQDSKVCAFVAEAVRACLEEACGKSNGTHHDAPLPIKGIFPVSDPTASFCACGGATANALKNPCPLHPNGTFEHQPLPTAEREAFWQKNAGNGRDIRNVSQKPDTGTSECNTEVPCSEAAEGGRNGVNSYEFATGLSLPSNGISGTSENAADLRSSQNFSAGTGCKLNTDGSRRTEAVADFSHIVDAENHTTYAASSAQPSDGQTRPNGFKPEESSPSPAKSSDAGGFGAALSSNSQSTLEDKGNISRFPKILSTADPFEPNSAGSCRQEAVADIKELVHSEDNGNGFEPSRSSNTEIASNGFESHPSRTHSSQKFPDAGGYRADTDASWSAETVAESVSEDAENTEPPQGTFDLPFFGLWQNRWALFNNTSSLLVLDCKGAQLRLWFHRVFSLLEREQVGALQTLLFPHVFSLEDRQAALFAESVDWLKFGKICIVRTLSDTQFQLEALPQWVPQEQVDLFVEQIAASLEYGGQMLAMKYRFEPLLLRLAQRYRFEPVTNEKQIRVLCRELQNCDNYVTDPLGNPLWNRLDADDLMGKTHPYG